MCSKESNINSNYNENSIAICSMFTHLKTITVQCEIGNGIFIPHLTRLYRPYTLDCFFFTSISMIHQNGWNEIKYAHTRQFTLWTWCLISNQWFVLLSGARAHVVVSFSCLNAWNVSPDILFTKAFDSPFNSWQYHLIN